MLPPISTSLREASSIHALLRRLGSTRFGTRIRYERYQLVGLRQCSAEDGGTYSRADFPQHCQFDKP